MGLLVRANHALDINPPAGDQYLTTRGSNWLWAVTVIFAISFLVVAVLSVKPRHGERIFHYLFTTALLVGAITYFSAASDLGWTVVLTVQNTGDAATYQMFWSKYIYWVVSFPTVIIALGLLSGVSWATIFAGVSMSWIWVISYLLAAFTTTKYRWGFFCFGNVAYISLVVITLLGFSAGARRVGTSGHFLGLAGWVNLLWLLYPIAFGVSDGGNEIGVTSMWIFFGVLDVLMVPVLAFAFVLLSQKWDYGRLNLHFTQYGRVAQGGSYPEKGPASGGVTGTGTGTVTGTGTGTPA